MPLLLLFLAFVVLLGVLLLTPWMETFGVARIIAGRWQLVADGWAIAGVLWAPLLVLAGLAGLLGMGLGALLRRPADRMQARIEAAWDRAKQEDLDQAQTQLRETQAVLKEAQRRLRAFQALEAREQALSAAEAALEAQRRQLGAEAETLRQQAQVQAQAIRQQAQAEAQATQAKIGTWKATLAANQRHLEQARATLAYARSHAGRLRNEFEFAKREGRDPNLPLLQKEARRLVRALTHPPQTSQEETPHEQARPPVH